MTLEEWLIENNYSFFKNEPNYYLLKESWDYQQTIIDELQYLNNLQQDRIDKLEAAQENE